MTRSPARVPNTQTTERRYAREQRDVLERFDSQVAEIEAKGVAKLTPYAWTTDDDEIALDAITVGIGDDAPALIAAGMTPSEPLANIYWPDWTSQGEKINASMEGPYPVSEALIRAEILCALWAYERVVIALQDRATWRREWGELHDIEGLD